MAYEQECEACGQGFCVAYQTNGYPKEINTLLYKVETIYGNPVYKKETYREERFYCSKPCLIAGEEL